MTLKRGLGRTQEHVLRQLAEHGSWHGNCGWVWNNQSGTILVLESLVRRGLVVKTREQIAWGQTYVDRDVYRVKVLAP